MTLDLLIPPGLFRPKPSSVYVEGAQRKSHLGTPGVCGMRRCLGPRHLGLWKWTLMSLRPAPLGT